MKYHRIIPRTILRDTAYWHNAIVHWVLIATLFVWVASVAILALFVHPSDALLRLQYNVFFGTSLHAPWWQAYLVPAVGLLFAVGDLFVGRMLYAAQERVAAYVILLGGLFTEVALLIASVSIVMNNFFL